MRGVVLINIGVRRGIQVVSVFVFAGQDICCGSVPCQVTEIVGKRQLRPVAAAVMCSSERLTFKVVIFPVFQIEFHWIGQSLF